MIQERFAQIVDRFAQNIALECDGKQLTYQQLDEQSDILSAHLIKLGVKPGDVVALSLPRGNELIVSLLSCLKVHATYLPLDTSNPVNYLQRCLKSANCQYLLCGSEQNCQEFENVYYIFFEDAIAASDTDFSPLPHCSGSSPAYIMFTSGSTGNPKGVVVPHRAILRLVVEPDYIDISSTDVFLQFAPAFFDASTFEIWGALLNGAKLTIYQELHLDIKKFVTHIKRHQVTTIWLTAAFFHIIAGRLDSAFTDLKYLLAGGDVLNSKLVTKVLVSNPGLTLINGYGPTENTTFTCCHPMTLDNLPEASVPIGKVVRGTTAHVLNSQGKPVLPGKEGVLHVSGDGVALGYLGQSNNDSAFYFNSDVADGLIYNTGDIVKCNESGVFDFVGRSDNQLKIRGFRVALEEVQTALMNIDGVHEAVVKKEQFENGDQRLIAILSGRDEITRQDVRNHLMASLPAYMIPSQISINETLPINKNGKVDRKSI